MPSFKVDTLWPDFLRVAEITTFFRVPDVTLSWHVVLSDRIYFQIDVFCNVCMHGSWT